MTPHIREADPAEYPRIGEITAAAYIDAGLSADSSYVAHLRDVSGRARHGVILVAADDATREIVGSTTFVRSGSALDDICLDDECEFRMLAVDPAAQRRGAGSALIGACLARARVLGARAVAIRVSERSAAARQWYERHGFEPVPDRDRKIDHGPVLLGYRRALDEV